MKGFPLQTSRAMTLVEILLSVSVIAALCFLIVATTQSIRARSREIACAARMRVIGHAIFLYQSDHQQRLPPNKTDNPGLTASNVWVQAIAPYLDASDTTAAKTGLKMQSYLTCPAWKGSAGAWSWWYSHYGVNAAGAHVFGFDGQSYRPNIEKPAETMMLMETRNLVRAVRPTATLMNNVEFRHQGHNQVLYFDGHMGSVSESSLPTNALETFWSGR